MEKTRPQWELDCLQRQACINAYARRLYQPRVRSVDKIRIYPPAEHRKYLQQHPCRGCKAEPCCDLPCQAYLNWYNARMEAARARGEIGYKVAHI